MIQALIFDMDGTLVNTELLHFEAWQQALGGWGVADFPFSVFLRYVGTSNEKVSADYIASHQLPVSQTQLMREKQEIYRSLIPKIELCAGVRQLLARTAGRYRLAVASSSHHLELMEILRRHGLADLFQVVFGGDMVANRKPHPEIYLKAAAAVGVAPEQCLAFEDSGHGLLSAKNAGMLAVAIPNEFTSSHDFSRADRVVQSLNEVDEDFLANLGLEAES